MYRFTIDLLQPFTLICLLLIYALVRAARKPKEFRAGVRPLAIALAALLLLCLPSVSYLAIGSLEWQFPRLPTRPPAAQAIVVLGGGFAPEQDGLPASPSESTISRCLLAADLYHDGLACPVLVCGEATESKLMQDLLARSGVAPKDLLDAANSLTTYENATAAKSRLDDHDLHSVVLVTDALHLPRAVGCFRQQGLDVIPAGGYYRARPPSSPLGWFLPSLPAGARTEAAFHEWLGILWYRLHGRL